MKAWHKFLLIILGVIVIYRDSFFAPFFQDDKILLNLPLAIIPNFPFRPISQQIFYQSTSAIFGLNPFAFHLILFIFFVGTLVLIFKLAKKITGQENSALLTAFFYAFNISIFANFYWIATSYFTIGAFFFFSTVWLYLQNKKIATVISYILALGSNEIAFTLPLVFLSFGKKPWGYLATLPVLLLARLVIGLPKASDYVFNLNFLPTLKWYLIRVFNLPEGVDRGGPVFYALFIVFLLLLIFSIKNYRRVVFGVLFFILTALPFFFMPNHMSSYYLTIALFGPAVIFSELTNRRFLILACGVYLILTVLGLDFLSQTHWIILKNTGPIGQF